MAIDVLTSTALKAVPESSVHSSRNSKTDKATLGESQTKTADSVMLTDSAMALAKATDIAKASDGIDHDKVTALKQAVSEGTYTVNYESVADHIIDSEKDLASIFGN